MTNSLSPSEISDRSRARYATHVAGGAGVGPWWDVIVLTASSERQAERYRGEIQRRFSDGILPGKARYLVVPDVAGRRIGSGGATLNVLGTLAETTEKWWSNHRVLLIHSGGDSRRLPQYSLSGKLFTTLPVLTPWGGASTVFDETLALSCDWAESLSGGLLVASGDVVLTFDVSGLRWDRPGISGVALRQPVETGSAHGVYVANVEGRVYTFLQKPSAAAIDAAGGLLEGGTCAVDSGLLRFDPASAARLSHLAVQTATNLPAMDLYQHVTMGLTGQWQPPPDTEPFWKQLAAAIDGIPFWCDTLEGDFTHVGTTISFHRLLTEETGFSRLYAASRRLQLAAPEGVRSAGVIIDSVLAAGSQLAPQSVVIECNLKVAVEASRGVILHGLEGILTPVSVPEDTVVHQVPVTLPHAQRGTVIRVYGLGDDPKTDAWFGQPMGERLAWLGIPPDAVFDGAADERTLWNAAIFPVGTVEEAWACARWMMGLPGEYTFDRWVAAEKFSLATSTKRADPQELANARNRRLQANWQNAAVALSRSGADIRPMLANAPGMTALGAVGRMLSEQAESCVNDSLTEAASLFMQSSLFLGRAGLLEESEKTRERAFSLVQAATEQAFAGLPGPRLAGAVTEQIAVSAPPRIDLGGGWSDTPPFCQDWGGTVLNVAIEPDGECPIRTIVRALPVPVVRCIVEGSQAEYRSAAELTAPPVPGDPFLVIREAVQLLGLLPADGQIPGLELRTTVDLPMGSGLGTSSILGATILRALGELHGVSLEPQHLSDLVMRLEQRMTTGGGWQDQAGGIYAGAKLITSGPGMTQHIRVQPVAWTPSREQEFTRRVVLYYTGIQRMAKNLLRHVVGSYLARETATLQVLHSIKTLAGEMAHSMVEGDWPYLGQLLNRHWKLNQQLDPHTTNAPISSLLEEVRPYTLGAKLAGAGGGGFLILLASSEEAAGALRRKLGTRDRTGRVYDFRIAAEGLRVARTSGSAAN